MFVVGCFLRAYFQSGTSHLWIDIFCGIQSKRYLQHGFNRLPSYLLMVSVIPMLSGLFADQNKSYFKINERLKCVLYSVPYL